MLNKRSAALKELLEFESAASTRQVVERYPELLEDAAIEDLARIAEEVDKYERPIVENLLALLIECRAVGIDTAFQKFKLPPPTRDLTECIASLIMSDDAAAMRSVVENCPELLGEKAEQRLLEMEADSSDYSADRTFAIIEFLRTCRHGDLVAACAAYERDLAEVENASRYAAEYAFMDDAKVEAEFLRVHPVLLRRQAEKALNMVAKAGSDSDPAVAALGRRARTKLETLGRLRSGDDARG